MQLDKMMQAAMQPLRSQKTSLSFFYDNPFGKFFLNEEKYSLWAGIQDPYKKGVVSMAADEAGLDDDPLRASYVRSVPMAKLYRGLLLQGYFVSPKLLNTLEDFEIREDDVFIASYPRSGTTWTAEIVSAIFSEFNSTFLAKKKIHERVIHLEVGQPVGHRAFLNNMKSRRLLETHLPISHSPKQLRSLKCKIIYVVRNPKDQIVSYYHFHQHAKYLGNVKHDWADFLDLYSKGQLVYGSWFEHVRGWTRAAQECPENVLVVSYEELKVDLLKMIKTISDFVGKSLTEDTIAKIVDHCSFSSMKDNPAVNRKDVLVADLFDKSQQSFMRKGVIGDWRGHFSQEQSELFDRLYDEEMAAVPLRMAFSMNEATVLMKSSPSGRIVDFSWTSDAELGHKYITGRDYNENERFEDSADSLVDAPSI